MSSFSYTILKFMQKFLNLYFFMIFTLNSLKFVIMDKKLKQFQMLQFLVNFSSVEIRYTVK